MARPTKPSHLKIVAGTAKKCRINAREPRLPVGAPPMPPGLAPAVRVMWRAFARDLAAMQVLAATDGSALLSLARTAAEVEELRALVASEDGPLYESGRAHDAEGRPIQGTGLLRARPSRALLSEAERRLAALRASFGLTPSSRAAVSKVPAAGKDDDPASKYI